jgi:hypothetical protein
MFTCRPGGRPAARPAELLWPEPALCLHRRAAAERGGSRLHALDTERTAQSAADEYSQHRLLGTDPRNALLLVIMIIRSSKRGSICQDRLRTKHEMKEGDVFCFVARAARSLATRPRPGRAERHGRENGIFF